MSGLTWNFVFEHVKLWTRKKWATVSIISVLLGYIILAPFFFLIIAAGSAAISYRRIKKHFNQLSFTYSVDSPIIIGRSSNPIRINSNPSRQNKPSININPDDASYAFIDLETTGLMPENGDKIIEIAVLLTDSSFNELGRYETLIWPNRKVSATRIHKITDEMVKDAPTMYGIKDDLIDLFKGRIIVAHNASFEKRFLNHELPELQLDNSNFLDTLTVARRLTPTENHKLETVANYYGVPYTNAHTAMGDVIIMREVLIRINEQNPGVNKNMLKGIRTYAGEKIESPAINGWLPRK
jgi:DNA polymerase III epsilon subunit family exonuclease